MSRFIRIASVTLLALLALVSVQAASAQMMHFTVYVVIETEDGLPIPAGEVCVSGEVDPICQDIPADTPTGREFEFDGLGPEDHEVTVSAEPYLEALGTASFGDSNDTTITLTLVREVTPPTDLPDTGAGVTAEAAPSALAGFMIAGAAMLAVAAVGVRRATSGRL